MPKMSQKKLGLQCLRENSIKDESSPRKGGSSSLQAAEFAAKREKRALAPGFQVLGLDEKTSSHAGALAPAQLLLPIRPFYTIFSAASLSPLNRLFSFMH
jgi:hypothetical protein